MKNKLIAGITILLLIATTSCTKQVDRYDKQVRLKMNFPANFYALAEGSGTVVTGEIIKFTKTDYVGVDSIIFVAKPYVFDAGNSVTLELYNKTDSVVIANSTLTTNTVLVTNSNYLQTGNLYSKLPNKEITLGITLKSGNGRMVSSGDCYIFLYRK